MVAIVYVDSASSDNSVEIARGFGAQVVELAAAAAPAPAFTAARARNAGAEALLERYPDLDYLQVLDGDTELNANWLATAVRYLNENPDVAVACGRRREKYPEASIYNQLADLEWNTAPGIVKEFGGDALIRASVFEDVHGYNPGFIAGEEPEFAARMRLAGYKIARLDCEMTLHDLHMTRFGQWVRRTKRSGHALAQLYDAHGGAPLHLYKRQHRSTLFWGTAVPVGVVVLAALTSWWALLLLPLAYFYLTLRVVRYRLGRGDSREVARRYAVFMTLAKFVELLGMMTYYGNLVQKRPAKLIEYKGAVQARTNVAPQLSAEH
jgi:glycosyltransferase involved in cell wall biosynthesis